MLFKGRHFCLEDDEGIEPKDLSDPTEQFLTAAEEGHLEALQKLFALRPELLKVSLQPAMRVASLQLVRLGRTLLDVSLCLGNLLQVNVTL